MASLSLRHLSKTYDNGVNAIRDFTLEVDDKEFMIFAGPVGCGISTVLRMIAGVEDITDGELLVDGERMNEVPSIDRNMAMIFKNGKLYPQMNIYDNLAFGLKLKELPKGEIDARIAEVTEVLKIGHLLDKMTEDLDEQERALVVLGRAMVTEYGMSDLGPLQFEQQEGSVFLGRDYNKSQHFSNEVANEIDMEMRKIINNCHTKATEIIKKNKDLLKLIAEALLEYETLTKEQIDYLVENGKMPSDEDEDSLEKMSVTKLRELAKEKGVKNYSKMNKAELLKELDD